MKGSSDVITAVMKVTLMIIMVMIMHNKRMT